MLESNKYDIISISKMLNSLLVIGFIISMAVNAVLGLGLWQIAVNKSRTVVPPSISKAFTVSDSNVDENYLRQMGEYFLYLKLNVTPANVNRQFGILLDYVTATSWSKIQPQLVREANTIQESNLSSTFNVIDVSVSLNNLSVKILGELKKSVGDRNLEPEHKAYIIKMKYENGLLELDSILKEADHD